MYIDPSNLGSCSPSYINALGNRRQSKRNNLRLRRLNRRRSSKKAKEKKVALVKKEMEIKNLKLYMENRSIIEENEKLRKKAFLLHQENQALLYQLQNKFSNS